MMMEHFLLYWELDVALSFKTKFQSSCLGGSFNFCASSRYFALFTKAQANSEELMVLPFKALDMIR